jgi:hypothetical protein
MKGDLHFEKTVNYNYRLDINKTWDVGDNYRLASPDGRIKCRT